MKSRGTKNQVLSIFEIILHMKLLCILDKVLGVKQSKWQVGFDSFDHESSIRDAGVSWSLLQLTTLLLGLYRPHASNRYIMFCHAPVVAVGLKEWVTPFPLSRYGKQCLSLRLDMVLYARLAQKLWTMGSQKDRASMRLKIGSCLKGWISLSSFCFPASLL